MNVFLDIDEAFLNSQDVASVEGVLAGWDEETRSEFMDNVEQIRFAPSGKEEESAVFLMRPRWKEYFQFLFLSDLVNSVNLWTWSDVPYAKTVAATIEREIKKIVKEGDKDKIKFSLVMGDEHVEESIAYGMENYPDFFDKTNTRDKDLHWVCDSKKIKGKYPTLKNSILIDDNIKNTRNPSNARNSINVLEWNPLDTEDFYDTITINKQKKRVLEHVMDVIKDAHKSLKTHSPTPFSETIILKNPKKYIGRRKVVEDHDGRTPDGRTTQRNVFYGSKECVLSKEEAEAGGIAIPRALKLKGGKKRLLTRRTKPTRRSRIGGRR
jgi:hypothetical protein